MGKGGGNKRPFPSLKRGLCGEIMEGGDTLSPPPPLQGNSLEVQPLPLIKQRTGTQQPEQFEGGRFPSRTGRAASDNPPAQEWVKLPKRNGSTKDATSGGELSPCALQWDFLLRSP